MRHNIIIIIALTALTACKSKRFEISSSSMEGTLIPGTTVQVAKTRSFNRGDIAVFDYYGDDYRIDPTEEGYAKGWQKWIFRVVALSGDTVELRSGDLFINNKPVPPPPAMLSEYEIESSVAIEELPVQGEGSLLTLSFD